MFYTQNREGLEVTDDVSIVEYLKHPVYVTQGSYTNIKVKQNTNVTIMRWKKSFGSYLLLKLSHPLQVTTPDDLLLAERILSEDS